MTPPLGRRQPGQTIVVAALGLVAMVGMLSLVIDAGLYVMGRLELQKMVDAAALAGVMEISGRPSDQAAAEAEATDYANRNSGFARAACTLPDPPVVVDPFTMTNLAPPGGPAGAAPSLHVTASCQMSLIFGRILWPAGQAPVLAITAEATAARGCVDSNGYVRGYAGQCPGSPPPTPPASDPRLRARLIS